MESERLRSITTRHGTEAVRLPARDAQDAARALELLSGHGVSLTEAAKHWLDWKAAQDASCTFSELWAEHLERKLPEISDSYATALEYYGQPLLQKLGNRVVSGITTKEVEQVLRAKFKTPRQLLNARRTIRPAFAYAVRRGYASANPFDSMEPVKLPGAEITVLTLEQVRAAFNACSDHRMDATLSRGYRLDCRDCIPAVAIMLFAGVRPKEIERLEWSAVHFDHELIAIGRGVAKTRTQRHIPMAANLRDWLSMTPEQERRGLVTPSNWVEKMKAIRHVAGFSRMQDATRHSFASYFIAANPDLNALQAAMGHSTPEMVLRHYRALVSKAEAIKFWSITPDGTAPAIRSSG